MKATWRGSVIAESDQTIVVEGNHYFPRESVNPEFLETSRKATRCPWKGRATYSDLVVKGRRNKAAAFHYERPYPWIRKISGHVAFWQGVKVTAD